jgi:hypothetical protein
MAAYNKQVAAVLAAWRAGGLSLADAARSLTALGWNAGQAWAFLERY